MMGGGPLKRIMLAQALMEPQQQMYMQLDAQHYHIMHIEQWRQGCLPTRSGKRW
jgi:hypothetical protein